MIKAHNVIPALKDQIRGFPVKFSAVPAGSATVLFINPWYDYQVVGMGATVMVVTTAVPVTMTLGHGPYTDRRGVIQPANPTKFLTAANALDVNGQPYSTQVLPVGTFTFFTVQPDTAGQGLNILPAGAPLTLTVTASANTGEITFVVAMRPKDKDRGDASKRPFAASDQSYATYFK